MFTQQWNGFIGVSELRAQVLGTCTEGCSEFVGGRKCLSVVCQDVDKNAVTMEFEQNVVVVFLRLVLREWN